MIPEILQRSLLAKVGSNVTRTLRSFLLSPDARLVAAVGEKTHWIDINPFTGIQLCEGVAIVDLLPQVQKSLWLFSETCELLVTHEPHPEFPTASGVCRVVIHWREKPSFVRGGGYLKDDPLPACCNALGQRNRVGEWIASILLEGEDLPFTALAGFDEFTVECPEELREVPRDLAESVVRDWNTFLSPTSDGRQASCRVFVLEPQASLPLTLRFQILPPPMVVAPIEPPAVNAPPPLAPVAPIKPRRTPAPYCNGYSLTDRLARLMPPKVSVTERTDEPPIYPRYHPKRLFRRRSGGDE